MVVFVQECAATTEEVLRRRVRELEDQVSIAIEDVQV